MKVEKNKEYNGYEIDIKRMYVPLTIKIICEGCGQEIERNLSHDYLSYPRIGEPFDFYVYHGHNEKTGEDCDTENFIQLKLDLNLSIID